MHASADRLDFAPPPPPGFLRAAVLAVVAHLLLLAALTWGINWKQSPENLAAEAELWSSTPQQAAPKEVVAPPPPPPVPKVVEPAPKPVPVQPDADIALEREKKRRADEKEREEKAALERQKKLEAQRKQDEQKKLEQTRLAAENRRKQEEDAKRKKVQEDAARKVAQLREENLRRIQGLAGATGAPTASGSAMQASGPSASYAGRIRARVKPNIVFTDDVPGNPEAVVEVRVAPDGTITAKRITKSSGSKPWDDAVIRALDKTEVLPRDSDGRVHSPLLITFRPKD